MPHPKLLTYSIVSAPFSENTHIAHLENESECLIIDPGLEPEKIFQLIESKGLTPVAILNTHGHSDHIAGNDAVKQRWPQCPLIIGAGDADKLVDPMKNLSGMFGFRLFSPPADRLVNEGDLLSEAQIELQVLETPGHSRGHVVFVWKGASPWIVFGGDVLFQGSIGRTDFPDGNMDQLIHAIHQKLFTMPDETMVLPGHGDATTIGAEKETNPFVGEAAGYRFSD